MGSLVANGPFLVTSGPLSWDLAMAIVSWQILLQKIPLLQEASPRASHGKCRGGSRGSNGWPILAEAKVGRHLIEG